MNWGCGTKCIRITFNFSGRIVPQVQDVLSSDDNSWKWFVLHFLVIELPVESRVQLKEYLKRVAETPVEHAEELGEMSKEILETI